ncbi:hypothetical protein BDR03DRAFT_1018181 [Suillus americanus]|nr:hypothetical protein BDR03DRAFT_1018181 [Suillus americanus]
MAKTSNSSTTDSNAILTLKAAEAGKSTHHRHAHMHTREEVGIAVETAQDLEASFAWAPLLSTEPHNADDLLAGPESILLDDIAAEFATLEDVNKVEVPEGNAFDFDELDRVKQGIIPQTALDEVEVVNYNGEGDGWDEAALIIDVIIRNGEGQSGRREGEILVFGKRVDGAPTPHSAWLKLAIRQFMTGGVSQPTTTSSLSPSSPHPQMSRFQETELTSVLPEVPILGDLLNNLCDHL